MKGQKPCGAVVHRPLRRGQVDHRQPGGEAAARAGPPHLPARRRQRPPRPEPGPRLHRRRPGREHPPRRRGRQADGRRRPDRADCVHLAVPRRAAHGARACSARASSSRSSSTRRWRWPRSATSRASTSKARRGELKNFTGIDSPYEAPEAPEIRIDTVALERRGGGRPGDRAAARAGADPNERPDGRRPAGGGERPMDGLNTLAGFGVGAIVGMTGVGGGALMTPILVLLFGVAPAAAVGTDLWFAALTKMVGGTRPSAPRRRRLAGVSPPGARQPAGRDPDAPGGCHATGAVADDERLSPPCARGGAAPHCRGDAVSPAHPCLRPLAARRDARPVQARPADSDRACRSDAGVSRHPDVGRRRRPRAR